jgi:hypothetical protein
MTHQEAKVTNPFDTRRNADCSDRSLGESPSAEFNQTRTEGIKTINAVRAKIPHDRFTFHIQQEISTTLENRIPLLNLNGPQLPRAMQCRRRQFDKFGGQSKIRERPAMIKGHIADPRNPRTRCKRQRQQRPTVVQAVIFNRLDGVGKAE